MARPPRVEPGFKVLTQDFAHDEPDDSYWGTGRVFVKPEHREKPMRVPYEFLASRLASAIGLPVPAGETSVDVEERLAWVTAVIDYDGQEFAPERPESTVLREPDVTAGIFVFDVWIYNSDRHEHNLVAHPKIGLWLIDHEHAFGAMFIDKPESLAAINDNELRYHLYRDIELDEVRLREWGDRIRAVPRSVVEKIVAEGYKRSLYTAPVRDAVIKFLLHRQAEVHKLVRSSRPRPASEVPAPTDADMLQHELGEETSS